MDNTTFNAAALTEAQYDGLACVVCGRDYLADPVPHVPVGMVDGGQVFACTGCIDRQAPAVATVPGTWPGGEPTVVRLVAELRQAAARLRADAAKLDALRGDAAGELAGRMRRLADDCDRHADAMTA